MKTKIITAATTIFLIAGTLIHANEVQIIRDASGRKIGTIAIEGNTSTFRNADGKVLGTAVKDSLPPEERLKVQAAEAEVLDRLGGSDIEIIYPPQREPLLKTLIALPVVAAVAVSIIPMMIFEKIINF